jgi:hypothetical protein
MQCRDLWRVLVGPHGCHRRRHLQVDMGAGHFSASDRYKYLKERAFELAFVCDQLALPPKAAAS